MPVPSGKHGCYGRIRPTKTEILKSPRLSTFLSFDFPPPPPSLDYTGGITSWGMLGNDRLGLCVIAGMLHTIMARTKIATGADITFTDDDAIGLYSTITGYDPETGANDNGTDMRTALEYWRTTGIKGNKIAAWFAIDPTNAVEVAVAMDLFGPLLSGITMTSAAESEFAAGQPWDYTYWTTTVGGHCVPVSAYRPGFKTIQTWAVNEDETDAFFRYQTEELYGVVDPDWFDATGKSPTGQTLQGLLAASAEFAGG